MKTEVERNQAMEVLQIQGPEPFFTNWSFSSSLHKPWRNKLPSRMGWVGREGLLKTKAGEREKKIIRIIFLMGFPIPFISPEMLSGFEIGDIYPHHHLEHQTQPFPACGFRAAFEGNNTWLSFWDSLGLLNMDMVISSRANSLLLKLKSWRGRRSSLLPSFAGKT